MLQPMTDRRATINWSPYTANHVCTLQLMLRSSLFHTTTRLRRFLPYSLFLAPERYLLFLFFFFLMIRHPPKSPLFPSTPLFRSLDGSGLPRRHRWLRRTARGKPRHLDHLRHACRLPRAAPPRARPQHRDLAGRGAPGRSVRRDRKSTRLNSSHGYISYAVFCLKK